ncbi:hypothetical protein D0Y65_055486 [Glycine soja]|uniref:BAG domain-containing protein n=1 Tax=Glycine soja TaxID=3848 RepID=A0A445EXQ3_GLYSO|nr:hypothetical protein D0Y65_055486 [Glycine soja]
MVTVRNMLGRWGKKAGEATKKAESLAGNTWQHWELKKMLTEPTGLHVAALEAATSTGGVIAELDIQTLTENLMRTLIALDEIYGEGELKLQRRKQVREEAVGFA